MLYLKPTYVGRDVSTRVAGARLSFHEIKNSWYASGFWRPSPIIRAIIRMDCSGWSDLQFEGKAGKGVAEEEEWSQGGHGVRYGWRMDTI
jgi:hypothetical protein